MVIKVLIFAVTVAAASADVHTIGDLPATPVLRDLPVTTSGQADKDPFISHVQHTHKTFTETEYIKDSDHYSYAYEFYDWKTGITVGIYESRYGETAVGTAYKVTPQHERTTVNFTVDPKLGLQPSVSKDVQTQSMFYGYASMAAPLAYDSFHVPEDEPTREAQLNHEGAMTNTNPYAQKALRTHNIVIERLQLEAPFNLTVGYQVKNIETGHTRSQYETYQKSITHGRYVEVGVDGSEVSVTYIITDKGIAITTPIKN